MFRGKRVHDGYVGEAYVFAAGCPPESYPVSGVVSADQRMVTLSGSAPTRNARCQTIDRPRETLQFILHDEYDNYGEN
jgi:hypothetical protein